jgi:hypothetical protein
MELYSQYLIKKIRCIHIPDTQPEESAAHGNHEYVFDGQKAETGKGAPHAN